jgi:hypothetical protein
MEYQLIMHFLEILVPEQFRELPNLDAQILSDIFKQVPQRSRTQENELLSLLKLFTSIDFSLDVSIKTKRFRSAQPEGLSL